jgi:hypothetical protein
VHRHLDGRRVQPGVVAETVRDVLPDPGLRPPISLGTSPAVAPVLEMIRLAALARLRVPEPGRELVAGLIQPVPMRRSASKTPDVGVITFPALGVFGSIAEAEEASTYQVRIKAPRLFSPIRSLAAIARARFFVAPIGAVSPLRGVKAEGAVASAPSVVSEHASPFEVRPSPYQPSSRGDVRLEI